MSTILYKEKYVLIVCCTLVVSQQVSDRFSIQHVDFDNAECVGEGECQKMITNSPQKFIKVKMIITSPKLITVSSA